MRCRWFFLAAAFLVSSPWCGRAQNLLVNGDFETPPFFSLGVVSGWTVGGNVASVDNQGSTSASHAASLSAGNNSQGDTLSQTFATMIGTVYTLEFDAGVYGIRSADPLQLQIQIFGAATLLNQTVTPPENGSFNPAPFQHYTFNFVADSASTTLQFSNIGLGNANADVMVDTVSVVPEASTLAALVLGGALLFGAMRRKRV
jgi:hypothetical protein